MLGLLSSCRCLFKLFVFVLLKECCVPITTPCCLSGLAQVGIWVTLDTHTGRCPPLPT